MNEKNTPKHLVFLNARFLPFMGGAERYTYFLPKEAAKAGMKVTVVTTDLSPNTTPLAKTEVIDGLEVVRVHRWNKEQNLGFYPGLAKKLIDINPDVVHVTNGPGFIWHDICLLLLRILRPHTKIIITPHGPFLPTHHHLGLRKWITLPARIIMPVYFQLFWRRLFHKIVAVTPTQHLWMTKDYGFRRLMSSWQGPAGRHLFWRLSRCPSMRSRQP